MKHNAKKKTNSEKYNAKFEGHNADILLMFWTINKTGKPLYDGH